MGRDSQVGEDCGSGDHFVLAGGHISGGVAADIEVRDGKIVAIGDVDPAAERVDVSGAWIAPAFIDSHVHLAYLPQASQMAAGGVAAAVDLASPQAFLEADTAPLRAVRSGPMITAVGGYPTRSWGQDGYGLEVSSAEEAVVGVEDLHRRGARVIKLPVTVSPVLDDVILAAATDRAHALGLKVVAHALRDVDAARAANAGADVLAHTPTTPLTNETVALWSTRAVITTLTAFGGAEDAVANLERLRGSGALVLYGTDFGNTRTAGIDPSEIDLLLRAGLDPAAILASGTSAPAAYWGLDDLGRVEVGAAASLLVLAADPRVDASTLKSPNRVYIDGRAYSAAGPCQ